MEKNFLISIVGPTAVGKTSMAIELAKAFDAEIISADSRQFFKEISIGTAKPSIKEQKTVKHHFINNLSISEEYNASDFEKEVIDFLDDYFEEKKVIVLCGGSGMYVDAVLKGFDDEIPTTDEKIRDELNRKLKDEGIVSLQQMLLELDPEFYSVVDLNNSKRLLRAIEVCLISGKPYSTIRKGKSKNRNFETIKIGLEMDRNRLYHRINTRVDQMMEDGLLQEAKAVEAFKEKNALKTVGYRELFAFFSGENDLEFSIEKIKVNSRRYAKRQLTWFKRDLEIQWYTPNQKAEISKYIRRRINSL